MTTKIMKYTRSINLFFWQTDLKKHFIVTNSQQNSKYVGTTFINMLWSDGLRQVSVAVYLWFRLWHGSNYETQYNVFLNYIFLIGSLNYIFYVIVGGYWAIYYILYGIFLMFKKPFDAFKSSYQKYKTKKQERITQNQLAQDRLAQDRLAQEQLAQEQLAQEQLAQERLKISVPSAPPPLVQSISQCSICYDASVNCIYDCGHASCQQCFDQLQNKICHSCRKPITNPRKIYF
jgi:hypothetical protein